MGENPLNMTPAEHEVDLSSRTFEGIVHQSQKEWRERWQNIKSESTLSNLENSEVNPDLSQKYFDRLLDTLPGYVSSETRKHLKETHPTPLYNLVLIDDPRRNKSMHEKSEMKVDYVVPENINNEDDRICYLNGLTALEEIAVDKLSKDIVEYNIKSYATDSGVPMTEASRKVARTVSKVATEGFSGNNAYRNVLKGIAGEKYEDLRQVAAETLMSGDKTKLENFLETNELGTLSEFSINFGRALWNDPEVQRYVAKVVSPGDSSVFATSLFRYGKVYKHYPGVIDLNLLPAAQSLTYGGIHETVHYLAKDSNRSGFIDIKFKKKSSEENSKKA